MLGLLVRLLLVSLFQEQEMLLPLLLLVLLLLLLRAVILKRAGFSCALAWGTWRGGHLLLAAAIGGLPTVCCCM